MCSGKPDWKNKLGKGTHFPLLDGRIFPDPQLKELEGPKRRKVPLFVPGPLKASEPPLIDPHVLPHWILWEDDRYLVVDKPGWVVCHPSKRGPLSSLVGACREYTGLDRLHLISRLDRETSGIVVMAKTRGAARICQMALERREVDKVYYAILEGALVNSITVNKHLARDMESSVYIKQTVRKSRTSRKAITHFEPLFTRNGFSLVRIRLETGRKHQIRAHALWLGHRVVGDKIYGRDETLYLEFIEKGWTPRLEKTLLFSRQALHASRIRFNFKDAPLEFHAPFPEDMKAFCKEGMQVALGSDHPVWEKT